MKKIFYTPILHLLFCTSYAQSINPSDSISTGPNYTQMVFYSLSTGVKTYAPDTDWHLAVSIRPTNFPYHPLGGTTIRCNEARGVHVYLSPTATAADFNTLDTTGWQSWQRLHDSDSILDLGAFNSNLDPTNIFDFGWGKYDENTHNVIGDSIFLIRLPDGELKKLMVVSLVWDTLFNLKYSNIDNSNLQNIQIRKGPYLGKQFVYLNLIDNVVHDKEPLAADWDLEGLGYAADFPTTDSVTIKTGVWANDADIVAAASGAYFGSDSSEGLPFSNYLDAIGWNWEQFNSASQTYTVQDSLAYFIKNASGEVFQIVFTAFRGPSTGEMVFYSELRATAALEVKDNTSLNVFPDPANAVLNISTASVSSTVIKIFDVAGSLLSESRNTGNTAQINTSDFPEGLYVISVSADGQPAVYRKFIVAH